MCVELYVIYKPCRYIQLDMYVNSVELYVTYKPCRYIDMYVNRVDRFVPLFLYDS